VLCVSSVPGVPVSLGIGSWLKRKLIVREVKSHRRKAMAGKLGGLMKWLWDLLDGHKGQIVSIIATMKLLYPDNPLVRMLDSTVESIWEGAQGTFDPANAAILAGLVISVGHHTWKSYRERKAGLPMALVAKSVLDMPATVVGAMAEHANPSVVAAVAAGVAPSVLAAIEERPELKPPKE